MESLNYVCLIGLVEASPEIKTAAGNQTIATFMLETREVVNGREMREHFEHHVIAVFGRQAQFCGENLTKGSIVTVTGKIKTRAWTDTGGNHRTQKEIISDRVIVLGHIRERKAG